MNPGENLLSLDDRPAIYSGARFGARARAALATGACRICGGRAC